MKHSADSYISDAVHELEDSVQQELLPKGPSFCRQVWDKLSRVDVSAYIEKKGDGKFQAEYVSWAWMYAQLMKLYPDSIVTYGESDVYPDGSVMINCTVSVIDGNNMMSRDMFLPVMSHTMKAVQHPDARQVSDTKQRAFVKCCSRFGLGLDLWAGSDYAVGVEDDPISEPQAEMISSLLKSSQADLEAFLKWLGAESVETIPVSKYQQARIQLENKIKRAAK